MRKLALVYFPGYAFLFVLRREFIVALFTDRYLSSVPIFAINITLIPLGIFVADPILRAYQEHRYFAMKLHTTVLVALAVALPFAIGRFGLEGAAATVVVSGGLSRVAGFVKISRILKVRWTDLALLRDVAKAGVAAACAASFTAIVHIFFTGLRPLVALAVAAALFGSVYIVAVVLLGVPTTDERAFVVNLIRSVWGRFAIGPARAPMPVGD